jgi:hypothetical protein
VGCLTNRAAPGVLVVRVGESTGFCADPLDLTLADTEVQSSQPERRAAL